MTVIDTSAIVAILAHEPERTEFFRTIVAADRKLISAVSCQEAGMVMFSRNGPQGLADLAEFIDLIGAEIVPHDADLAERAVAAFRRFGKGIDPRARLNFCDCAAYALAAREGVALVYKGEDFAATDLPLPA